jgi:predicted RNase H-like HicB family nuclease
MSRKAIPALIWKEGGLYVAKTLGLELASQGKTTKEALRNLQEALDLLLEDEGTRVPYSSIPQNPKIEQVYA